MLAVAVPPDGVLGQRIDDGVLVLRAAAGMDAGLGAERAARDDGAFLVLDGVLVKRRRGMIPVHRGQILEAELVSAAGAVPQTRFLHEKSSTPRPAAAGAPALRPYLIQYGFAQYDARPPRPATYSWEQPPCQDAPGRNLDTAVTVLIHIKSDEFEDDCLRPMRKSFSPTATSRRRTMLRRSKSHANSCNFLGVMSAAANGPARSAARDRLRTVTR